MDISFINGKKFTPDSLKFIKWQRLKTQRLTKRPSFPSFVLCVCVFFPGLWTPPFRYWSWHTWSTCAATAGQVCSLLDLRAPWSTEHPTESPCLFESEWVYMHSVISVHLQCIITASISGSMSSTLSPMSHNPPSNIQNVLFPPPTSYSLSFILVLIFIFSFSCNQSSITVKICLKMKTAFYPLHLSCTPWCVYTT